MTPSVIYYTRAFASWKEPLAEILDHMPQELCWQQIERLMEAPVSALVLLCDSDVNQEDLPLFGARNTLFLSEKFELGEALKWIDQGAHNCLVLSDITRIATWLAGELARGTWQAVLPSEQQEILQTVLDAIPVPIFFKDELHIYRGCNLAFSEFLGISAENIIGHSVYDVAPKERADIYYQADVDLLAYGGTQVYEAMVSNAQGELCEIEFNKAVFYKANGDKGGQVGAMLDVTERNRLMRQLDQASRTDPLTGAANRREFNQVVSAVLQDAQLLCRPTSLLTIDIDHFKLINDAYGHTSGDEALKFLVHCIYEAIPEDGQVFRIGGEEFYVLLPNTELAQAKGVAEHVRKFIPAQSLILKGESVKMTVSIGGIQLASEAQLEDSFKRVDQALYDAKTTGRNRVCLAYYD